MDYHLKRSNRKTLGLQIKNGELIVRAPLLCGDAEIERMLQKNAAWIEKRLAQARERAEALAGVPVLSETERIALVARAREAIEESVRHYAALLEVDYQRITLRTQRSRWGSCTAKGNLSFNALLALAPREVLDSVVVHELCHRKRMDHSPRFYAEVLRVFPQYYACRKWLKENGDSLMARL